MADDDDKTAIVLYDPECPACASYCAHLQAALPDELQLVSARHASQERDKATQAGLDLDRGFVVFQGTQTLTGADAIHALSRRLPPRHRIQHLLFGRLWMARLIYPLLALGRRVLLRLMGVSRLNNLRDNGQ